jgi:phenylalanyl-tRNA synthetase beta chain
MKFPLSWLRRHLETESGVPALVEALTMIGIEVEGVEDAGARLGAFSVARIVEAVQHPNADRLRVCQVDTVDGRREIVCGAPNARAGLVTVYAPLGTFIPGSGITLEARPVRGVVSNGMLCSAAELQVADEADGILELDEGLAVGTPAAVALGLDDPVFDVEVTPNRPDWLGVRGIARDLAARGLGRLLDAPDITVPGRFACPVRIALDAPEACPLFAGRVIRGVCDGPSPDWLARLLRAVGLRPISALVDITNFLSLDRARPLHVYDLARLSGDTVHARLGREGERFEALDGRTYAIDPRMCVIADADGPLGLGGVMGGASSGVGGTTTDVFIESAWFDPLRTFQTGRATGIVSDARYRFERGVDDGWTVAGLEAATALILDICGGEASDIVVEGAVHPLPDAIDFGAPDVARLTGMDVAPDAIAAMLEALGCTVSDREGARMGVSPPSWRRDLRESADLVEEVARLHGFDRLPETPLPPLPGRAPLAVSPLQQRGRLARRALAARGFSEAVTWSFLKRAHAAAFGGGDAALVLANPIAADLDCMRPSILPNLAAAAQRNANRGQRDARLFEVGPVYLGDAPDAQRLVAAALVMPTPARSWAPTLPVDAMAMKALALDVLETLGVATATLQTGAPDAAHWHPGQAATLRMGPKVVLAGFGALHPAALKALDIDGPAFGVEIVLDAIPAPRARGKARAPLERADLMPLTRDFAFVLPDASEAQALVRAIGGADKALVADVTVFDVYRGKGVPEGARSLAVQVTLQPRERTLTDADIEAVSSRIISAASKVGATLRA